MADTDDPAAFSDSVAGARTHRIVAAASAPTFPNPASTSMSPPWICPTPAGQRRTGCASKEAAGLQATQWRREAAGGAGAQTDGKPTSAGQNFEEVATPTATASNVFDDMSQRIMKIQCANTVEQQPRG